MAIANIQVITEDRASGAQVIDGSLKTDHNKTQYFSKTVTEGNRSTHTYSFWTKLQNSDQRPFFGGRNPNASSHGLLCRINGGKIQFGSYNSGAWTWQLFTSELYRDFSGWYHIVFALDTTQATAADRVKIYINGRQVTAFDTASYPSQNYQEGWGFTNNTTAYISAQNWEGSVNSTNSLYWSNFYFIDGQQLGPEYFGYTDPVTNIWRPKKFIKQASPNDGTTWSSYLSASSGSISNAANAFNNDVLSFNQSTVTEAVFTFTPPTPIQYKNSVRIWLRTALHKARINGGTYIFNTGAALVGQWMTLATGSGSIQSIDVQYTGGSTTAINAIEVDGVILVDGLNDNGGVGTNGFYLPMDGNSPIGEDKSGRGNDWTPVNFGGSNSIEKATGALPILNTVSGGNVATAGVRTDSNSSGLVLALPLVGSSADVHHLIKGSGSARAITTNGDAAASSTQSNFYGGSFSFDGTGDSLDVGSSSDFNVTTNYTVESWVYFNSLAANTFFLGVESSYWIAYDSPGIGGASNKLTFTIYNGSSWQAVSSTTTPVTGRWHHIAAVKEGTSLHFFLNGVKENTTTMSGSPNNAVDFFNVAKWNDGGTALNGYMQDVRVYSGVAKYTSNFIPASTDPDILPDTPSGVASGSALTKITDGAVAFDGSGDSLVLTDDGGLDPGSGDFTLECFINTNNISGERHYPIIQKGNTATNNSYDWRLYYNDTVSGTSHLWFDAQCNSTNRGIPSGSTDLIVGRWYHVAVTRQSGTFRLFLDGILQGSNSDTTDALDNDYTEIEIGFNDLGGAGDTYLDGYVSNVRFVKGTALYTSDFTPPTSALTNVTNTTLLCCQDTTGFMSGGQPILNTNSTGTTITSGTRYDHYASSIVLALAMNGSNGGTTFTDIHPTIKGSGSAKTVTVNGNVQTSTALSKYYGSSGLFDGNGDYLSLSSTSDFGFGTGDFTIECFVYFDGTGINYDYIFDFRIDGGGTELRPALYPTSNGGALEYYLNGSAPINAGVFNGNRWYHIAVARNSSTTTLYVDGTSVGSFSDSNNYADAPLQIGQRQGLTDQSWNGYIQDFRVYKGVAKYTSNFTVTAPSFGPNAAVTPGSITAKGHAAATNFNPFTTDINAVRGQESGYATLNPLSTRFDTGTLSNGNLTFTTTSAGNSRAVSTIRPSSGKWYCEFYVIDATRFCVGVENINGESSSQGGGSTNSVIVFYNRAAYYNSTSTSNYLSAVIANGDVIQVALDLDNSGVWIGVNGIWANGASLSQIELGNVSNSLTSFVGSTTPLTGDVGIFLDDNSGSGPMSATANFGQKPFKFPPPDGFQTLNAANVRPSTVVARPDQYFNTTIYTGASPSDAKVTGVGFQPDFVWIKARAQAYSHTLYDTVRGATEELHSDTTDVEDTDTNGLKSFDSDGFTVGSDGEVGDQTGTRVAWCWKAGGNSNTFNIDGVGYATASDAGLTGGTIALTGASVNTDAGFSILTFTGTGNAGSIPHGLTQAPDLLIGKNRDRTTDWKIYLPDTGNYVEFNLAAQSSVSNAYTGVTSSLINLQATGYGLNYSTDARAVVYCWHNVEGLQKFGSYSANNDSSGPYIHLGFRPAMVIVRSINGSSGRDWLLWDSARNTYNGQQSGALCPNGDFVESDRSGTTYNAIDFLSDGFKLRTNATPNMNASSESYIYMAWAEAPTLNLYGAQANAR